MGRSSVLDFVFSVTLLTRRSCWLVLTPVMRASGHILKLFTKISHIHTYNTRSSKSQFFSTKYSRLNLQKKAFSRVGVKICNKIPNEFKTLSKDSFNKQMKTSLFQILDSEDAYLDVEIISSKLKDCIIKTNLPDCFTI